MSPRELDGVGVAEMNLLCAQGLPGAEKLDVKKCLKTLDEWAEKVRFDVQRHYYKFRQNPAEFSNSEGEYCMMMLISVLQLDCGVHYNMERVTNIDFKNAQDLFIHGMIDNGNGGTCASMPVLYTAVARRLGWPVKLVHAKGHVFCRWDGDKERFNIEGSGRGFNRKDDNYYMKWPHPISEQEVKTGLYLKSLTPPDELAGFLAARGHCLEDNGRLAEARVAYALAHQLAPKSPEYMAFLAKTLPRAESVPPFAAGSSRRAVPYAGTMFGPTLPNASQQQQVFYPPGASSPYNMPFTAPVAGQSQLPTQNPFQPQGGLP